MFSGSIPWNALRQSTDFIMYELIEDAGIFAWPLGLCSVLAIFIIIERLISLRNSRVLPNPIQARFLAGEIPEEGNTHSVAGRILLFFEDVSNDAEQLKAYARLQISRMERGLFILEVVISVAPLIGLLGTVTGLIQVFSQITPETGLPDTQAFIEGVALALTTTMLGLSIAIPTLAFHSYLGRRIESYAAQLEVGVERLITLKRGNKGIVR